ncbi:MAG: HEAT repeat domain-containing protein [Parachlamydiales bacterium]
MPLIFLFPLLVWGQSRELDCLRQIGDTERAVELARYYLEKEPNDPEKERELIRSLAAHRVDGEAARLVRDYFSRYQEDWELAERVAWASLGKGGGSSSLATRVAALVGAVATNDIQAVDLLLTALKSKEATLRGVALELAPRLRDRPIQQEVERLVRTERVRSVRIAAIRSAALMQMEQLEPLMREIVADKRASTEERLAAVVAAAELMEDVSDGDLNFLATHPRAGMRMLACEAIALLDRRDRLDLLPPLLADSRPDVRLSALSCAALFWEEIPLERIEPLLKDPDSGVAITAAYVMTLKAPERGRGAFAKYLKSKRPDEARMAAAALAQAGTKGVPLAQEMLRTHSDPYVKATLALGLLGQRVSIQEALAHLYTFCMKEPELWMWKTYGNGRFRALAPSNLGLTPRLAGAREAVDQMARLEILSLLALFEHPRAEAAIKKFLKSSSWGVSGVAAMTLLEEGEPEEALEVVRGLLKDPDEKIRVQAALGLALWGGDPSAAGVLEGAYPAADRELKIQLLEALGKIGSRSSLPFLLERLDEPFDTLRVLAASALIQCLNH